MFLLEADELLEHTKDIIHEETQKQRRSIDLTISKVYSYTKSGSLDFGGSEFKPAQKKEVASVKQSKKDKYGWWVLQEGTFEAVFNESLDNLEDALVAIVPHSHAQQAGILAETRLISADGNIENLSLNFCVPVAGCSIKENARFATLYLIAK